MLSYGHAIDSRYHNIIRSGLHNVTKVINVSVE